MNAVNTIVKYPGTAAGGAFVEDALQAIYNIIGYKPAAFAIGKSIIILEENTGAQVECECEPVSTHLPAFSKGWCYIKVAIHLHQGIVQLVRGPHNALVFGKSRVKRGDASGFVVVEHFFAVGYSSAAARPNRGTT